MKQNPSLAVYATFGKTDMNLPEAGMMAQNLPRPTPYDYVVFDGGHEWAPTIETENAFDWLEEWTYFGIPAQPAGKESYLHYLRILSARIAAAQDDFDKFESSDRAVRFATSHKLTGEHALVDQIQTLRKSVADLSKDPGVKRGIAAKEAYEKVFAAEELARRRAAMNAAQLKIVLAEAVTAYQTVSAKHPDTRYAGKAAQAVERLNVELK